MAICLKCGKQVSLMGRECPYCHTPMTYTNLVDDSIKNTKDLDTGYDQKSQKLLYKSIFFPYGIYSYLTNKDEYPLKASSALGGAMIGIIITLLLIILIMVAVMF